MKTRLLPMLIWATMGATCSAGDNAGAGTGTGTGAIGLDDFVDGRWRLEVDRAWDGVSGAMALPSDPLDESAYQPDSSGVVYDVELSSGATHVRVGQTPFEGDRTAGNASRLTYALDTGTFAGGRFEIWEASAGIQGELTLFGSGRPVVQSERGAVVPDPE